MPWPCISPDESATCLTYNETLIFQQVVCVVSLFGVLNLNKPLHCTSHDVVAKVRKKLGFKKVGHCGTLDPLATGVLPVCLGHATRLIEYFPSDKRYRAEITFGKRTLSWDGEGEFLEIRSAKAMTQADVQALIPQFQGVIQQQVPPHAAVHVNGKKLYELTRKGIAVELPVREAVIYSMDLIDWNIHTPEHPVATLDIHCASGTYIRSIAQALGELSGYGAYLSKLARTAHGQFTLEDSIDLEAFIESPNPLLSLQNPAEYLPFPQIMLDDADTERVFHGMKLDGWDRDIPIRNDKLYLLLHGNTPVAVAAGEQTGRLKPVKVFPKD